MLKNILHTFGSKVLVALVGFLLVIFTTNLYGADGKGVLSLIVLDIAIAVMVSNFVGGAALVYLAPRRNLTQLLIPSYIWGVFAAGGVVFFLYSIGRIEEEFLYHILVISWLHAFQAIHTQVLLGQQRIAIVNLAAVLQVIMLLVGFLTAYYLLEIKTLFAYIIGLYSGYASGALLTTIKLINELPGKGEKRSFGTLIREIFTAGFTLQLANLVQLLNYRLSYYLLEYFGGNGEQSGEHLVGVYSVGIQLSEVIWIIGKSIGMVQYSRIANEGDSPEIRRMTLQLLKVGFILTTLAIIVLLVLPSQVFAFVFGEEFDSVKEVIKYLSIGILAIGISNLFSHYFSGTGRFNVHVYSTLAGLVCTVGLGLLLIPRFGLSGAAITASASYLASTSYLFYRFKKIGNVGIKDLKITFDDLRAIKKLLKPSKKDP